MSAAGRYRFGFDIGGTFTDFVLIDAATGAIETYKTLTTPANPSDAVREGWRVLLERTGAAGGDVETAIHATTLITNALIERKGARTALLTTEGFGDVLDTQREMRYDIYDLHPRRSCRSSPAAAGTKSGSVSTASARSSSRSTARASIARSTRCAPPRSMRSRCASCTRTGIPRMSSGWGRARRAICLA